ncbi:MAG: metallophosphoesterase family protein [Hyphomicrobiales bacterium]
MSDPIVQDLGDFAAPVLVFGGVYGNLEALDALIGKARALGIPPDRMIHTGDVAAYCADARAAAEKLQKLGCPAIKGNVEEQLAAGAGDCACGFDEGSECDLLALRWYAHADGQTTPELRRFMADMPDHLSFTMAGRRFLVVHGGISLVNEFMFRSLDEAAFAQQFIMTDADCVIAGHTGLPFSRVTGHRLWHNSGALGLPANDGTPRVWFSVIMPTPLGIDFHFHALDYDHGAAAAKMRDAGLPEGYAGALETGLWPNLDILPGTEAAETGLRLDPPPTFWHALSAAAE